MRYLSAILLVFMVGCAHKSTVGTYPGNTESERINSFFDQTFQSMVARSPEIQTALGIKTHQDKLDDRSAAYAKETYEMAMGFQQDIKAFDYKSLGAQEQLSYDLFVFQGQKMEADWEWRKYSYVVNQMFGIQSELPSFMISKHQVTSEKDLQDYISRLNQFQKVYEQTIDNLKASETAGVIPPKFVFPKVLSDIRNLTKGKPFQKTKVNSALMEDFAKKLAGLKLPKAKNDQYTDRGIAAMTGPVATGFKKLETYLVALEKKATNDHGVWKFPRGDEYYSYRLAQVTTTDYTADFVHKLGLMNVDRIHGEMKKIMKQVKFKGDLQAFFKFMMSDKQFFYPQNSAGEKKYLTLATKYIDSMRTQLPKMFQTLPKAKLVVKPVENFRAKTAGLAFYEIPAPDGTRPGMYYVNLSNLKGLPTWEAEALAYHEALPGHHMQLSISQEMTTLPMFRRYYRVTAFTEGWGLYSEKLPLSYGSYKDPYSNFGRLSMELWRACRLVVDTGLHSKRWTRQKAIQYLAKNTPSDNIENTKAIDRYIVMPGQATGYMVGMLKILELKQKAQTALGSKFDIRIFHDVILRNGAVPLNILEKNVIAYIQRGGKA